MKRHVTKGLVVVAAAALALAGCGDDGGSGADGDAGSIKIMTLYTDTPTLSNAEIAANVEAAAKKINDEGGINGRDLKVIPCNNQLDPNVHVTCIRTAIKEKVAAVVGSVSFFPTVYEALEKADIAWLGGFGILKEELNSPIAFPVSSGEPGWYYGEAKKLADLGMQNPAWIQCEPAACKLGEDIFRAAWKKYTGKELTKVITLPDKATDLSPYAADLLSSGVDSIATGMYVNQNQQLTKELRGGGFDGPIAVNGPNITPETLVDLGSNLGEFYVVGGLLTPSAQNIAEVPAMQEWHDAIEAYEPGLPASELGLNGWTSTLVFADIAKRLDEVNNETVLEALRATTSDDAVTTDLAAPFFAAQDEAPLPDFARLASLEVSVAKAEENGDLVQDQPGLLENLAD